VGRARSDSHEQCPSRLSARRFRPLAIDFGPDHPNVAIYVNNLGSVLKELGHLDGARQAYQRALTIFEMVLGSDHQRTQTVRSNLAALAAPSQTSFSAHREKGE
jgi:hypothetical protein